MGSEASNERLYGYQNNIEFEHHKVYSVLFMFLPDIVGFNETRWASSSPAPYREQNLVRLPGSGQGVSEIDFHVIRGVEFRQKD